MRRKHIELSPWPVLPDTPRSASFWYWARAALSVLLIVAAVVFAFTGLARRLYQDRMHVVIPELGRYPVDGCQEWTQGTALQIDVWRERGQIHAACRAYQDVQR